MRKIFIAVLGLVMFASGCSSLVKDVQVQRPEVKLPADDIAAVKDLAKPVTEEITKKVSESQESLVFMGVEGKTALELLKEKTKIETKSYGDLGEFVLGINGVMGDAKKYWAFYVNGEKSNVGAGSYQTKTGDKIEWKLESVDSFK